ncbi:unnamed protein product [Durusdinium trenchii]|uniref:Uncharacterized protein n=1 Tax=Durusdinium trenchii TaxID=1381693 RepID=A0ABP0HMY7_9DINO
MVAPPRELHLWKVLLCFLLRPSCCLEAYVAPSFSAAVGGPFSGAPAILSFTTSAEENWNSFENMAQTVPGLAGHPTCKV